MKSRFIVSAAVACVALSLTPASQVAAGTPLGGLTAALSPDGSTLLAAGDNRTFYVLDAGSLEVRNRVWVGHSILRLSYNKDGSVVAAEDTDGTMHLFSSADFSSKGEHKEMEKFSVARGADIVAGLDADFKGNSIRFASLTDGSEKGRVSFDQGARVFCFGLNAAGDTLAVLQAGKDDAGEPKVPSGDIPKDLKGLERDIFEQKNDGRTSMFQLFKVPGGEKIAEHKVFFTSTAATSVLFAGEDALIVNYSNENARIKPDGTVEMFEFGNSYNYGIGAAADQGVVLTGGMRSATVTRTDGMVQVSVKTSTIPGWPEYFKGFCANADGPCYGATSAYRIIKFGRDGKIEKEAPCF